MMATSPCERLDLARRQRGLRQADLVTLTGMTQPTVSAIFSGRRKLTLDSVIRLARALNVSLDWILEHQQTSPS